MGLNLKKSSANNDTSIMPDYHNLDHNIVSNDLVLKNIEKEPKSVF
jgi:hypothetical protein